MPQECEGVSALHAQLRQSRRQTAGGSSRPIASCLQNARLSVPSMARAGLVTHQIMQQMLAAAAFGEREGVFFCYQFHLLFCPLFFFFLSPDIAVRPIQMPETRSFESLIHFRGTGDGLRISSTAGGNAAAGDRPVQPWGKKQVCRSHNKHTKGQVNQYNRRRQYEMV